MTLKELLTPIYISIVENKYREQVGLFLGNKLVDSEFIFISIWSVVHLLAGGVLFYLIDRFNKKLETWKKFAVLFGVLAFYEFIEYFMYINLSRLFIVEPTVDLIWDLIIGVLGGVLVWAARR